MQGKEVNAFEPLANCSQAGLACVQGFQPLESVVSEQTYDIQNSNWCQSVESPLERSLVRQQGVVTIERRHGSRAQVQLRTQLRKRKAAGIDPNGLPSNRVP